MKTLRTIFRESRELVVLAPLAALVMIGILALVAEMTGRPAAVSLVPLVEFGITLVRVVVCAAFAALIQGSVLGWRAEKAGGELADDALDAVIYLLIFVVMLIATAIF